MPSIKNINVENCQQDNFIKFSSYIIKTSVSEFTIYTLDGSDVAANAAFDYQISRS